MLLSTMHPIQHHRIVLPPVGPPHPEEYGPWVLLYGKQGEPWVSGGLVTNTVGGAVFLVAVDRSPGARVCYYEGERGSRERVSG
jgi:hypothetical protein